MEETQNQTEVNQVTPPQATSFSVEPKPKNGAPKWVLIFIGLLILGGAGIFFFTRSDVNQEPIPTPTYETTPYEEVSEPLPTKSPEPVKKDDISIEIQNGTGITGEAVFLQGKLKILGYTDIKAGNAVTTDNADTTVTFLKTTPQTIQDEIKKELEKIYKTVNVKTSTTQKVNVLVLTGLRIGQTPKPSATPTASGTASPSPTPTATPT